MKPYDFIDILYLFVYYETVSLKDLSILMKRPVSSVYQKAYALGLTGKAKSKRKMKRK